MQSSGHQASTKRPHLGLRPRQRRPNAKPASKQPRVATESQDMTASGNLPCRSGIFNKNLCRKLRSLKSKQTGHSDLHLPVGLNPDGRQRPDSFEKSVDLSSLSTYFAEERYDKAPKRPDIGVKKKRHN